MNVFSVCVCMRTYVRVCAGVYARVRLCSGCIVGERPSDSVCVCVLCAPVLMADVCQSV